MAAIGIVHLNGACKIGLVLTVRALCSEMEALGRPLSERAARDWCSKGLIPHPLRRGLGRGRGSEAFWTDPRIVQQARTAYDLLARYPRADFVRLSLWLLGFRIELRAVRAAYSRRIEHSLGDGASDENVGELAATFARQLAKKTTAPAVARDAITDLTKEFLGVFYGMGSEFVGEGLAALWQKAAPFVDASTSSNGLADLNLSDEDIAIGADYLNRFVSLPAQLDMIRSASDYELTRARRLIRFVLAYLRRNDPSSEYRDDIESLGGWLLVVFGRPAVPILVRVLREDAVRQEIMSRLLAAARTMRTTMRARTSRPAVMG